MKIRERTDNELIKDYQRGDNRGIEILFDRYHSKLFSYVNMIVRNKEVAEDISQDTFLKAISVLRKGKYNEEGKFPQWLMRIGHNLSIDYFRKLSRMPIFDTTNENFDIFDLIGGEELSVEERIVMEQIHSDVRALLDLLPAEQKTVMYLRHYQNMSFKEIAEQTNVSINTALGRMRYALMSLRKIINKKNIVLTA
ncbi:MAG: RNA polymerase sigma factor [Bacteroidales bacterium]|jgi:RNA polymerase sigma-70 factor (ECF subfamily)|nr:sigma-70 family RNA polymerase sigma factor [Bacteroidales bacterium]